MNDEPAVEETNPNTDGQWKFKRWAPRVLSSGTAKAHLIRKWKAEEAGEIANLIMRTTGPVSFERECHIDDVGGNLLYTSTVRITHVRKVPVFSLERPQLEEKMRRAFDMPAPPSCKSKPRTLWGRIKQRFTEEYSKYDWMEGTNGKDS